MDDITVRLRRWEIDLMDEAADEIVALRAMVARESDVGREAVRLMTANASRYGFLLGGLDMIAAGHTTASNVLAAARAKYGD